MKFITTLLIFLIFFFLTNAFGPIKMKKSDTPIKKIYPPQGKIKKRKEKEISFSKKKNTLKKKT